MIIQSLEIRGTDKKSVAVKTAYAVKGTGLRGGAPCSKPGRELSLMAGELLPDLRLLDGLCTARYSANITTLGLDYTACKPGSRFSVGGAVLELTAIGKRCFDECPIRQRGERCPLPTHCAFAKVVTEGSLSVGDVITRNSPNPFSERYVRNIGPGALTPAEQEKLRNSRALIVGCGGLGGTAVELLARAGVGALRVVDGDVFEASNLNRQLLCREDLLGTSKVKAAEERAAAVNSSIRVEAVEAFFTEKNAAQLLDGCGVVVDALDNAAARRSLADACKRAGLWLVHGAVSGWMAQVTTVPPGGGTMDLLYPPRPDESAGPDESAEKDESAESGTPTPAFTPMLAASVQAAEAVKLLAGREPGLNGRLLLVDLLTQTFETVELQ